MNDDLSTNAPRRDTGKRIGRMLVFVWFVVGGVLHFVAADTEVRLVPPYIPWPYAAVWLSGALELMGAGGVLNAKTRRAAGIGLFALTIAVTPVHIYMLQQPGLFDIPYWALIARLPLQGALLWLIAWSTFSKLRS